jgi:endonuclease/exonuclease/phosphatase family metal-dependent hydrolase
LHRLFPMKLGWATTAISAMAVFGAAADRPVPATPCAARNSTFVRWIQAWPAREAVNIDRWCAGVGAPARVAPPQGEPAPDGAFAVVSWNTHVGAADVDGFVADLRLGRMTGGAPVSQFVLLLQEAYRAGRDVPAGHLDTARWASAERPPRKAGSREDILTIASRLRLHLIYVPSMRNGAPHATDEDRGNAILSTVPLTDIAAIELPLEKQRRVAIQAVVRVRDVPVTIVDTHFTNTVMHHLWVLSESGRMRQARALARVLPREGPLIVGGDFNAWFGSHDAAYREMAKVARPALKQDSRASFGPLRLDHVLFRLPDGWRAALRRADQRYGSDHYPLIATIEPG